MMTKNNTLQGHLAAFLTIFIWGTTFISTKVLLKSFGPIEILFYPFPHRIPCTLDRMSPQKKKRGKKRGAVFRSGRAVRGNPVFPSGKYSPYLYLCLQCRRNHLHRPVLYGNFLLSAEKGRKAGKRFFLGFIMAMAGIFLISGFGGLNPFGDLLAVGAAILWAAYSLLTRKISDFGYPVVQATRRTFFYGLIFMIPALFLMDFHVEPRLFWNRPTQGIFFPGTGGSALCFVTWNFAVRVLGSIKTSVYIYMVPVVTTVTSALILKEKITAVSAVGILLTLGGLFLSQEWGKEEGDSPAAAEEIGETGEIYEKCRYGIERKM